jgi:hypothetical protein
MCPTTRRPAERRAIYYIGRRISLDKRKIEAHGRVSVTVLDSAGRLLIQTAVCCVKRVRRWWSYQWTFRNSFYPRDVMSNTNDTHTHTITGPSLFSSTMERKDKTKRPCHSARSSGCDGMRLKRKCHQRQNTHTIVVVIVIVFTFTNLVCISDGQSWTTFFSFFLSKLSGVVNNFWPVLCCQMINDLPHPYYLPTSLSRLVQMERTNFGL